MNEKPAKWHSVGIPPFTSLCWKSTNHFQTKLKALSCPQSKHSGQGCFKETFCSDFWRTVIGPVIKENKKPL